MRRCDGSVGSVIGVTLAGTTNSKSERPPPAALRKHPDTLIWGGPETRDQRSLSQEDDVSYRRVRFRERELSRKFQNREPANLRFPLPASIQRRSCGRNRMQKKTHPGFCLHAFWGWLGRGPKLQHPDLNRREQRNFEWNLLLPLRPSVQTLCLIRDVIHKDTGHRPWATRWTY